MQTVTLQLEDKIYKKFFLLLNNFSKNEVKILDQSKYISDDDYLRSINGMEESIVKAANEPIENYVTADKLEW